jgi:hypothetical protein
MIDHDDNPASDSASALSRYGCLECQEDAELAVGDRLHPGAEAQYRAHLRACSRCRRRHHVLEAVYRGPDPSTSGINISASDREFAAILRRVPDEQPLPWYQRLAQTSGVVILATTAVALAVPLVVSTDEPALEGTPIAGVSATLTADAGKPSRPASSEPQASEPAFAPHQARVDYGRVIAGRGFLSARGDGPPVLTDIFTVGTRFTVDSAQSLQVGFLGRILANFEPGTEIEWTGASGSAFDLILERGTIAVRYEREPGDPILNIHTPSAVVRVVGTVFTVAVDAEGHTDVAVLRGKVEVCNPEDQALITPVQAGYRFDLERATFSDVGRHDVRVAMPLSDEGQQQADDEPTADGTIPASWVVPGLPDAPGMRRLEYVLARAPITSLSLLHEPPTVIRPTRRMTSLLTQAKDDGQSLIDKLVQDQGATRREASIAALERCKELYQSPQTRYLSARCFTGFMAEHGDDADVVEGHLLIGILRMDYANDYPAAKLAFERFLERAPGHPDAELARYRLWLANTERGAIHEAIDCGREYLRRYPTGKYTGKILQRFPKLVSELASRPG